MLLICLGVLGFFRGIEIINYVDKTLGSDKYFKMAQIYEEEGDLANAAICYGKSGLKTEGNKKSRELWAKILPENKISAGNTYSVAIRNDGTIISTNADKDDEFDYSDWENIVSISAGQYHCLGITS